MHPNSKGLRDIAAQLTQIASNLDGGLNIKEANKQLNKVHTNLAIAMHRIKPNNTVHSDWKEPALAHDIDKLLKRQLRLEENGEKAIINSHKVNESYPYRLEVLDREYAYVVEADRDKDWNLVRQVFSRNSQKFVY